MEVILTNDSALRLRGHLLVCDKVSPLTGYVYPSSVMIPAIEKFNDLSKTAKCLGFVGTDAFSQGLQNVSHWVNSLLYNEQDNTVDCSITISKTQRGRYIREDILYGKHAVGMIPIAAINTEEGTNIITDISIYTVNLLCSSDAHTLKTQFSLSLDNIIE